MLGNWNQNFKLKSNPLEIDLQKIFKHMGGGGGEYGFGECGSNTELSELFCPRRVPRRELSEFLSTSY